MSESLEKSANPWVKAILPILTGGATAAGFDAVRHNAAPFTGEWDWGRGMNTAFNALMGAGAGAGWQSGLKGKKFKAGPVMAGTAAFGTIPVKDLAIAGMNPLLKMPATLDAVKSKAQEAGPKGMTGWDKAGLGAALLALLGGGGYLGYKGIQALNASTEKDQATQAVQEGGKLRITLPTRDPDDQETQIEIPISDLDDGGLADSISKTQWGKLRRDLRRKLRAETSERTRRKRIVDFPKAAADKKAVKVERTSMRHPNRWLAESVGRVLQTPNAVMVGQEDLPDWYKHPDEKDMRKAVKHMSKDKHTKGTVLRLNASNIPDDVKRLWANPNYSFVSKLALTPSTVLGQVFADLSRSPHYNPGADSAVIYGDTPELAMHEVGHAKDFESGEYPGLYAISRGVEQQLLGVPGPLTMTQEVRANSLASEAEKNRAKRHELRRRVWPGTGTYVGAIGGGLASMLMGDKPAGPVGTPALTGLIGAILGAAGGRGAAEIRNVFDKGASAALADDATKAASIVQEVADLEDWREGVMDNTARWMARLEVA